MFSQELLQQALSFKKIRRGKIIFNETCLLSTTIFGHIDNTIEKYKSVAPDFIFIKNGYPI